MAQELQISTVQTPDKPKHKGGRPKLTIAGKNFGKTVTVILKGNERVQVPVDAVATRDQCRILTAKALTFFEDQLEGFKGKQLTPKEVQDLVVAAARLDDLMRTQYATDLNTANPGASGALNKAVGGAVASAAEGAVKGLSDSFLAKLSSMEKAAKKVQPEIIEADGSSK